MATSAVSSSTSSTATTTAPSSATAVSNKANAQKIMTALSAGSGVDVTSLAQNLVDAERVPRENEINTKIGKTEAKISGYSAILYSLGELNNSFKALKDESSFTGVTATTTNNAAFSATATATASIGSHDVEVLSVAKPQRSLSNGFLTANWPLNNGSAFTLKVTMVGGLSMDVPIAADKTSPAGVVSALNAATVKTGVKAQLVNTGDKGTEAVPSVSQLPGPLFGSPASTADFSSFQVTIAGQAVNLASVTPAAATPAALASALQTALRSADGGATQLSVTVDAAGTGLLISDASGRSISNPVLTPSGGNNAAPLPTPVVVNAGATAVAAKPYKIVLTGPTGALQAFTMTSDNGSGAAVSGLDFATSLQSPADAVLKVNGLRYTRPSNSVTDVITGVTLNLKTTTPAGEAATVDLTRDTSAVEEKLNALVTTYNDANSVLNVVSDPKSQVDQFGGSLVGDSTVRRIREQMRSLMAGVSSTPSNGFQSLWQLGISQSQTGEITVDSTKLKATLSSNFEDVVTMFSGNNNNLSSYSTKPAGLAGDAFKKLTNLTATTGSNKSFIQDQITNSESQVTKYKADLDKLNLRMEALLTRYTKQFAAMDSLVGQTNSMKTSLKSSFDGMMAAYTNK